MKNSSIKNYLAKVSIILSFTVSDIYAQDAFVKTGIGDEEFVELNNPNNLPACPSADYSKNNDSERIAKWNNCWGRYVVELSADAKGNILEGEWRNGKLNGYGIYRYPDGEKYQGQHKNSIRTGLGAYTYANGDRYIGEFKNDMRHGLGRGLGSDGRYFEGLWSKDEFVRQTKVARTVPPKNEIKESNQLAAIGANVREPEKGKNKNEANTYVDINRKNKDDFTNLDKERRQLAEERKKFEEEKRQREQARTSQRINLQITNTPVGAEGDFVINIQTNIDTASLKINGEEFGGREDGKYVIKKVARAGQETKFTIVAKDTNGNTDSKTIAVSRQLTNSNQIKYAELNPALIKQQRNNDAVAIIIGIADYKKLPKADFASDDARIFYDYAIRGLGVKAENIKMLLDSDADQAEILKAFKSWLPPRVKSTTDVYVFYSGHGLPSADGQSLYVLPQQADRELIEETAIAQTKLNAAIQATKPKSVTIFLDSCYSGSGRAGQTLLASARPVSLKANTQVFPAEFTVITASTADQISSSSPELKHGIFSYYLMKGMEGEADSNKDGKITAGEMHSYLTENVARQASLVNRVQQPQLTGDANRVLIGRQ